MARGNIDRLPFQLLAPRATRAGSADSVVKVFTQMRLPNPVRPWVKQNPVEVMGSGVVIERKADPDQRSSGPLRG